MIGYITDKTTINGNTNNNNFLPINAQSLFEVFIKFCIGKTMGNNIDNKFFNIGLIIYTNIRIIFELNKFIHK